MHHEWSERDVQMAGFRGLLKGLGCREFIVNVKYN